MATLKDELASDPEGRGYSKMALDEILADLTELRYPAETIDIAEIDAFIDTNLLRPVLRRLVANESAPQQARDIAETCLSLQSARYETVTVAIAAPLIDALVQVGVFTPEHKAGLLSLAEGKRNRFQVLDTPVLDLDEIREYLAEVVK